MYHDDKLVLAHLVIVVAGAYISFRLVSRPKFAVIAQDEPARTACRYLKFALITFFLYALFHTVLMVSNITNFYLSRDMSNVKKLKESGYYPLHQLLRFCSRTCLPMSQICDLCIDALIALILSRLITAILNVHLGGVGIAAKSIRIASYGLSLILAVLVLIVLSLQFLDIYSTFQDDSGGFSFAASYLGSVFRILFRRVIFATSLAVTVGSVIVNMQTKTNTDLARASTMLVAASVVWLLHASMLAGWILFTEDLTVYFFQATSGMWLQFVILIIFYIMWFPEANGIWSKQNPLAQARKDQ
ncbi:hypothetical protein FSHL1_009591 [Fusarium sambucinum]